MREYAAAYAALPIGALNFVAIHFAVTPNPWRIFEELKAKCIATLDVILVLSKRAERWATEAIETLAGCAVHHCPPAPPEATIPSTLERLLSLAPSDRFRARRVVRVLPRVARPGWTPIRVARFEVIREGMTIGQLLSRGIKRDDIRDGERAGWLVLTPEVTRAVQP